MRILIVDDDPEMRELIRKGLTAEGYETTTVDDGVKALLAITKEDFAMAAVDVMLPGMTGFEICRRIREAGHTLPLLLLTARDAVEDRVYGLDAGADDYLTKPFAFTELSARIRALLRRDAVVERLAVTVGNLRLDAVAGIATVDSKTLSMSPKEFAFVRLLANRAESVVGRATILEEVWGTTANIDPNIVDQYVSYLRRKLDAADANVRITTKRGTGFTLERFSLEAQEQS